MIERLNSAHKSIITMKKLILFVLAALTLAACGNKQETKNNENMKQELNLTQEWDKVFPLSDKVNHRKVTFETQYGLTLAADLYEPKGSLPFGEGVGRGSPPLP